MIQEIQSKQEIKQKKKELSKLSIDKLSLSDIIILIKDINKWNLIKDNNLIYSEGSNVNYNIFTNNITINNKLLRIDIFEKNILNFRYKITKYQNNFEKNYGIAILENIGNKDKPNYILLSKFNSYNIEEKELLYSLFTKTEEKFEKNFNKFYDK